MNIRCARMREVGKVKSQRTCQCFDFSAGFTPRRTVHLSFVPDEEVGGVEGMGELLKTPEFCRQWHSLLSWLHVCFRLPDVMHQIVSSLVCVTLCHKAPRQDAVSNSFSSCCSEAGESCKYSKRRKSLEEGVQQLPKSAYLTGAGSPRLFSTGYFQKTERTLVSRSLQRWVSSAWLWTRRLCQHADTNTYEYLISSCLTVGCPHRLAEDAACSLAFLRSESSARTR